jgi:hypothetical protein
VASNDPTNHHAADSTVGAPEPEPIRGWRKPWALVGWGVLIAFLIGVIIYGSVLLSQSPGGSAPAGTTSTATTTSPAQSTSAPPATTTDTATPSTTSTTTTTVAPSTTGPHGWLPHWKTKPPR